MKKLLLIVPVLLWASVSSATIALVQSTSNTTSSASSLAKAYGSNVASGNLLVLAVGANAASRPNQPTSIVDTRGNTWMLATSQSASLYAASWTYYAVANGSGVDTVTVTFGASASLDMVIAEYSGLPNAYVYETQSGATSSSTPLNTGTIKTLSTDLLVSVAYNNNSHTSPPTFGASAGYALEQQTINPNNGSLGYFDNFPVSAGSLSNSLTASPLGSNPWVVTLVAFRSATPSRGWLQEASAVVASATTASATLPFVPTAGDLIVVNTSTRGNPAPTSVSDGTNTYYQLGCTPTFTDVCLYYAMNVAASAVTVTVTYSGSQQINLTVNDYIGYSPTYAPEIYHILPRQGFGSGVTSSVTTLGPNELLFAVVNDENGGTTTFSNSSGFSQRQTINNANSSMVTFDIPQSSAGAYSLTVTDANTSSTNVSEVFVAFRSALQTIDRPQYTQFTTSSSQAFPFPNLSGDLLIAMLRYGTPYGVAVPTDSVGNTWVMLPITLQADAKNQSYFFYARNVGSGTNTVTMTGSGADGMQLWEYRGLASVSPLAGSGTWYQGNSSTTINPGTVSIPSTGILFSVVSNLGNTSTTFTGESGFIPVTYSNTNSSDSIQQWDEIITAGSYDNAITASTSSNTWASNILALSTTNLSYPVQRQTQTNGNGIGADGSLSTIMISPVVAGNLILALSCSQVGSSTGTISDSQGNSYTLIQGGGANLFGMWYAVASTSGPLTLTNTNVDCLAAMEFERIPSPILDKSGTAITVGMSLSTPSITTTHDHEVVVSIGNLTTDTNRWAASESAGWGNWQYATAGHYASVQAGIQANAPIGSYFNTFTFVTSAPLTATIASFYSGASLAAQPSISVITEMIEQGLADFGQ